MTNQTESQTYCHKLVKETAQSMAKALYDSMCSRSNAFYEANPSETVFVAGLWPTLVEEARATLVDMLAGGYPDALKEEIAAAIIADNTLTRGRPQRLASRLRTGQVAGLH